MTGVGKILKIIKRNVKCEHSNVVINVFEIKATITLQDYFFVVVSTDFSE